MCLPRPAGSSWGACCLKEWRVTGWRKGYGYVRLSVDANNVNAQGFYEACGLTWSDAERLYVARGDAFIALAGSVA